MPNGLPPIDAEIPCSSLAINTPMTVSGVPVSVDFRGGRKYRVETNPGDESSVRMRIVGHKMYTGEPSAEKHDFYFEQNDVDVDSPSILRMTQRFPPRYEFREVTSFTMTIDRPEDDEPIVLTTKDPMVLIGQLTQFPPRGDLFQLEKPVELVTEDDPTKVVAVIEKFPVKIGGL
ncbi:hypothetical protein [Streptomyces sp. NPDC053813]|uniref:hypothetical protein n=1 Tax=Streptomyces sp. NPDC053813 TaxID=3365717 RepID=UPI0037CCF748